MIRIRRMLRTMLRKALRTKSGRPLGRKRLPRFGLPLILLFIVFLAIQSFYYIEQNIREPLMNIARVQVHQLASEAISDSISNKIVQQTDIRELITLHYNNQGEIQSAVFNYSEYARIQTETTKGVLETLHALEDEEITIPLGQAFNSNILAHMGPQLPVRLRPMGSATVDLSFDMQSAGINMVMITVYAVIKAHVAIVMPFSVDSGEVSLRVPLSNAVIVGQVPNFYYSSDGRTDARPPGDAANDSSSGEGVLPVIPVIPPVEF